MSDELFPKTQAAAEPFIADRAYEANAYCCSDITEAVIPEGIKRIG